MKEYAAKLSIFLFFCDGWWGFPLYEAGFFLVGKFFKASSFQAFKVLGIQPFMREPKTWGAGTGARLLCKMLK